MAAGAEPAPRGGRFLEERPLRARLADPIFQLVLALVAALVLLLIGFFFAFLIDKARPALAHQGVLSLDRKSVV